MIRKYYARSIVALVLIPVTAMLSAGVFNAIDPELARGHANYVRNFALLRDLRNAVLPASLVVLIVLWLMACAWLLRAKARRKTWLALAILGPLGFAVLIALSDRSPTASGDLHGRQQARPPPLLRMLFEVLRFAAFGCVAFQLVDWLDDGTALLEATRRGVALTQVLAERDASSGMWAFGDTLQAACLFVFLYAAWPIGRNVMTALAQWLKRRGAAIRPYRRSDFPTGRRHPRQPDSSAD